MPLDRSLHCISVPANGDLSANQFRIVCVDADGEAIAAAGAGTAIVGVLRNKPSAAGHPAEIAIAGVSRVEAAGAINEGAAITSDADGKATTAGTADVHIVGMALTAAAADGDLMEVMIQPTIRGGNF